MYIMLSFAYHNVNKMQIFQTGSINPYCCWSFLRKVYLTCKRTEKFIREIELYCKGYNIMAHTTLA